MLANFKLQPNIGTVFRVVNDFCT